MPSFYLGSDYLALPRTATWVIEPIIPVGGAVSLYGEAKIGKSFAALQLGAAVLSGAEWLGFPVQTHGPVVYIQLDTPRAMWMAEYLEPLLADGYPVDEIYFADRETLPYPFDIRLPDHFHTIAQMCQEIKPSLTIIDTLKESNQAEENSTTEMQQVIAQLYAATTPSALALISHPHKHRDHDTLIEGMRGAGYTNGRMDTIIKFSKKRLHLTGRMIEEQSVMVERLPNGLWTLNQSELDFKRQLEEVMQLPSLSLLARAKRLAILTGKSEEACRSRVRRYQRVSP